MCIMDMNQFGMGFEIIGEKAREIHIRGVSPTLLEQPPMVYVQFTMYVDDYIHNQNNTIENGT